MSISVSVILPSLNSAVYIRETLDSVVNQSLNDIEIICVDAGSTDGTVEIISAFAERDSRIKLIHSNKKSYGYQINLGLDYATGEYFGIVETDDYIRPDMYETLYSIAVKYGVQIVKGDFSIFVDQNEQRCFTYRPILSDKSLYNKVLNPQVDTSLFRAYGINPPGIYQLAFVREKGIRLNETPGASYQDNGLWFQMFAHAETVYFYNRDFYMVRRDNPNSSVHDRGKVYCLCEEYDFIRDKLKTDSQLESKLAPICAYYRYGNYVFTLGRIADEFKREFVKRFSTDFLKIKECGELDASLYTPSQLKNLYAIMDDPELYYFTQIYFTAKIQPTRIENQGISTAELEKLLSQANITIHCIEEEIKAIRASWTYRVGRFITWLPRKIRGGIRCYQEHGWNYTWHRILVHFGIKKY